jgi:hypothetical protein
MIQGYFKYLQNELSEAISLYNVYLLFIYINNLINSNVSFFF